MVSSDEATHWRTLVGYNQTVKPWLKVNSLLEIGSENYRLRNPFRIHSLEVNINRDPYSVAFGRLVHWNSLANFRVDGMEFRLNSEKLGSIKLLGGFKADTDFSDTTDSENALILASWSIGKQRKSLSFSYWNEAVEEENKSFLGTSFHFTFIGLGINNSFVWDNKDSRVHYLKFRLSKRIGKHRFVLGYRQKRYATFISYPWSDKSINITPTAFLNVYTAISNKFIWQNNMTIRFLDESTNFFQSTIQYRQIQLSLLGGQRGSSRIIGGLVGISANLRESLSYGCSLSVNALDLGDVTEPRNSAAFFGWLTWRPYQKLQLRIFARFHNNPYYKIDGRGGLVVNLAL